MGADHTLLVTSGDAKKQAQQVHQIMGCMPDITMECSGTQAGLCLGIYVSGLPLSDFATAALTILRDISEVLPLTMEI